MSQKRLSQERVLQYFASFKHGIERRLSDSCLENMFSQTSLIQLQNQEKKEDEGENFNGEIEKLMFRRRSFANALPEMNQSNYSLRVDELYPQSIIAQSKKDKKSLTKVRSNSKAVTLVKLVRFTSRLKTIGRLAQKQPPKPSSQFVMEESEKSPTKIKGSVEKRKDRKSISYLSPIEKRVQQGGVRSSINIINSQIGGQDFLEERDVDKDKSLKRDNVNFMLNSLQSQSNSQNLEEVDSGCDQTSIPSSTLISLSKIPLNDLLEAQKKKSMLQNAILEENTPDQTQTNIKNRPLNFEMAFHQKEKLLKSTYQLSQNQDNQSYSSESSILLEKSKSNKLILPELKLDLSSLRQKSSEKKSIQNFHHSLTGRNYQTNNLSSQVKYSQVTNYWRTLEKKLVNSNSIISKIQNERREQQLILNSPQMQPSPITLKRISKSQRNTPEKQGSHQQEFFSSNSMQLIPQEDTQKMHSKYYSNNNSNEIHLNPFQSDNLTIKSKILQEYQEMKIKKSSGNYSIKKRLLQQNHIQSAHFYSNPYEDCSTKISTFKSQQKQAHNHDNLNLSPLHKKNKSIGKEGERKYLNSKGFGSFTGSFGNSPKNSQRAQNLPPRTRSVSSLFQLDSQSSLNGTPVKVRQKSKYYQFQHSNEKEESIYQ